MELTKLKHGVSFRVDEEGIVAEVMESETEEVVEEEEMAEEELAEEEEDKKDYADVADWKDYVEKSTKLRGRR